MAEPGDHEHDHDDLIGFASPASLVGQRRELVAEPEPEPVALAPEPERPFTPEPIAVAPTPISPSVASREERFGRRDERGAQPDNAMSLYAVYALILFAVPTLGVSALIGLLAVTGRTPPASGLGRGHFIFQQRTLWSAAVIALLGAILIVVNIGVFVLFVLALWILIRGAVGVLRLKAGRPIQKPLTWLI